MPVLLDKILRAGEGKILKRLEGIVKQVNSIEEDFTALSDDELRGMTDEFRKRLEEGETLDDLLPEAFATVRETAKRTLGQRHFDVQIMGGAAMHLGNIAEMKTGEGKTLVATLPSYLNALSGKGVHVVTVNDYLVRRDAEWMGRIHRFLGLEVGTIVNGLNSTQRRAAYAADITYGTNNEVGFDYLRDNMAQRVEDMVQRGHNFAIVDEVDSILIDEARTPLIISGPADQPTKWYGEFSKLAQRLRRETDYEVDEKKRTVGILEPGIERVEDWLGIENLYESANTPLIQYLNNSIKAKELYRRDKEYVVVDGSVLIVDEHTGRVLGGRRYNEGMHQAIEAKEGVEIKQENQTLASVTLQNYFRLYDKLAGMTGTAMTEASEFDKIYSLGVVPIPPNRPLARMDQDDQIYRTEDAKYVAVAEDLVDRHKNGQPVLVGTTSVEKSERLSQLLRKRGVPHEVLNAKQHDREAAIIAQAGRRGAVTVATNMAGRGTDIMLGGNHEFMAAAELKQRGLDPVENPEEYAAAEPAALEKYEAQVAAERDEVRELGGLYVLGTERHESRRIDNQLRGRSGRQGDPGESRFYLSLQDDLMRLFKAEWVEMILRTLNQPDDVPIEHKRVSNAVKGAQAQREAQSFEARKDVLKYDDVLNTQRTLIYDERRRVLGGEDLHDQVLSMIDDSVTGYVRGATREGFPETWDLDELWTALKTLYPVSLDVDELIEEVGARERLSSGFLVEKLVADARNAYAEREETLGSQVMRELERRVLLTVIDRKWREHLYEMDYLREGIGLRAFAQKQPLVEYQREGFDLFTAMMDGIKEESVRLVFNLEVQVKQKETAEGDGAGEAAPVVEAEGLTPARRPAQLQYSAPTVDGDAEVQQRVERTGGGTAVASGAGGARGAHAAQTEDGDAEFEGVARNALCPCGSGKKFKRCHGDPKQRAAME
ncbi:preprotein translocase subunit SecA [Phytoactinopolyspora endophytica]|uniref:preprotein translocase subunit SecA n=1 Tax=Phytoactinopolyspora endophytica TaxID=1642495 RepID=UPI00101D71BF|nr:preprotein translocase subunit SecA [Phytoactinopolyspora endophytica]